MNMTWTDITELLRKIRVPNDVIRGMADPLYAEIIGRPAIDMLKFDDWLHTIFGNFEAWGSSMKDIVHREYPEYEKELEYALGVKIIKAV